MKQDEYNLERFIEAQDFVYSIALRELQNGLKRSHWMWHIFPQLRGLGHSYNSNYYGISGLDEAKAYIQNPMLSSRLREVSETILNLPLNNVKDLLGEKDTCKLCSSMTLFDMVSPNDIYAQVLDKYFAGQRDENTIKMVNA